MKMYFYTTEKKTFTKANVTLILVRIHLPFIEIKKNVCLFAVYSVCIRPNVKQINEVIKLHSTGRLQKDPKSQFLFITCNKTLKEMGKVFPSIK